MTLGNLLKIISSVFAGYSISCFLACRKVAKYLLENFLAQKGKEKVEVVNLSSLLKRKTKRESARVFYETLVMFLGSFRLSGNFRSAKY